jgi:REP element-mobilizing transposase RayT
MARKPRIEYPGAIYHVMSRGDRQEDIFNDNKDRQRFLETLTEACEKTGWQVHAYCLMRNHFYLVLETPNGNLVAGMKWLLGTYTSRFNRRHNKVGHVFSGRYKALVVDGSSRGYLKTVCDYVHLNPVQAKLLTAAEPLQTFRWSSFGAYLAPPAQRPAWLRVDRLLGEHGMTKDNAAGRLEFGQRMEHRRAQEDDGTEWQQFPQGWFLGGAAFKAALLEQMAGNLSEYHTGEERREGAQAKAERIIQAELKQRRWQAGDLARQRKGDPIKVKLAARLRQETT